MSNHALEGFRVVDLTQAIAGPFCTRLLADCGAEVIKVERPAGGDPARHWGPFAQDVPQRERSGLFLALNRGKRSLTLNLRTATGVTILKHLAAEADLLVESYRPGTMASFGLAYEDLRTVNPALVYVSISNFGQTGPRASAEASELTLNALGGAMAIMGDPAREPLLPGGHTAQYMAGLAAYAAALGALYWAQSTGEGQHVDVSIQETVATNLQGSDAAYIFLGLVSDRAHGHGALAGHPVGIFPCRDGYVSVMPGLGGMPSLALLVGHPELENHPLFTNARLRVERAAEFDRDYLLPYLMSHDKNDIVREAQDLRMPFARVQTMEDLLRDEHLKERSYFEEAAHPDAGQLTYPGPQFRLEGEDLSAGHCAPLLGEHTYSVLWERLGYSDGEIVALRAGGVV